MKRTGSGKSIPPSPSRGSSKAKAGAGSGTSRRLGRYVSAKVAARNSSLNVAGGVKVDVFVRVRPLNERELAAGGETVVEVDEVKKEIAVTVPEKKSQADPFTFDHVFGPASTQKDMYNTAVQPVVDQVVRGLSCCIFAYGQTGTGKTYTMLGELEDPDHHGIVMRAVGETFERLQSTYDDVKCRITYLEVYNEQLEDLFDVEAKKKTLRLVDDSTRGTVCHGLTEVAVENKEQVMALLLDAQTRCRISDTKMNKQSNRAHRIFTLLTSFTRAAGTVHSALTLVDLAGSESIGRSGAEGAMAKEAGNINKSLLTLGRVINALASNHPHIPYRDSKLTRLTSEALGGVCKTSFIATITPSKGDIGETLSTLRYARNAMEALNVSQLPRWKQDEIMIEHLKRQVANLEQENKDERDRHRVDEALISQKLTAVTREKEAVVEQLDKSEATVRDLQEERTQLTAALHTMTAYRDRLTVQKAALKKELQETRVVRDGYYADRQQLQNVLAAVRRMRNRLLEAHQSTERSLSGDVKVLQGVITQAVADVGDLEADVATRKELSLRNEHLADEFRESMGTALHGAMDSVGDFRSEQVSTFEHLRESCAALLLSRQQGLSSLRAELKRVAVSVAEAHDGLASQVSDYDLEERSRQRGIRDTQREHRDTMLERLSKLRDSVDATAGDVQTQVVGLDDQLKIWADKVTTHLVDAQKSAADLSTDLGSSLAELDAKLESASSAHLGLIDSHKAALAAHLAAEKEAVTRNASRLVEDIQAQVERLVSEHSKQAMRRVEAAVSGFSANADAMTTDLTTVVSRTAARTAAVREQTKTWLEDTQTATDAASTMVASSLEATLKTTGAVQSLAAAGRVGLKDGTSGLSTLSSEHLVAVKSHLSAASQARTAATESLKAAVSTATAAHQGNIDAAVEAEVKRDGEFKDSMEALSTSVVDTNAAVCDWTEAHNQHLGEVQADIFKYCDEDLERDSKPVKPPHKYEFDILAARTPAYRNVLSEFAADWEREEGISTGALVPGPNVDFGDGVVGCAERSKVVVESCASSVYDSDEEAAPMPPLPRAKAPVVAMADIAVAVDTNREDPDEGKKEDEGEVVVAVPHDSDVLDTSLLE